MDQERETVKAAFRALDLLAERMNRPPRVITRSLAEEANEQKKMLKEILKEWLLQNIDCTEASNAPDVLMFGDHVALDVNALAQFILENPCTD